MSDGSNEFPFSERYRVAGEEWAELEAAAQLLEDTKSAVLAERMSSLGDIPVNRAESMVKASSDWRRHIEQIVEARRKANIAKVRLEVARMEYYEAQSKEANARVEARL